MSIDYSRNPGLRVGDKCKFLKDLGINQYVYTVMSVRDYEGLSCATIEFDGTKGIIAGEHFQWALEKVNISLEEQINNIQL